MLICTEILCENNDPIKGNTLIKCSLNGKLQETYTLDNMTCPLHVAVTSSGNILLSDVHENCVFEVDSEGNVLRRMGNFKYPGFICTDDHGVIIVSDPHNHCIKIFHPDGKVKDEFGSLGTEKGQLWAPFGVATDGENILVAEGDNNRVQIFQYDGTSVCVIESKNDALQRPRGLALTKDGYVYVVDRDGHCIKKYKYKDMV